MEVMYARVVRCWRFIVVLLLSFHCFCFSENAPHFSFIHEATSAARTLRHDYIIIGGGTAGCPLAATLSGAANVLLLERGGSPYGNPNITDMANFGVPFNDNSPSSPSQQFISTDGVYNNRARVLGGGSCLNAGFFTRAEPEYVRKVGWNKRLVRKSYEWVEKKVAFEPAVGPWQTAVKEGLLEVGVSPDNGFTFNHSYGTKVGGTIFDRRGHRHTAADLLGYAHPRRITVLLHATVHKILFSTHGKSKPRAAGVIFRDAKGVKHTAYLTANPKSEIIVSSGAIGSPQLLMLSGIGPASHLRAHGIDVVVDLAMVGQGMADNPMNAVFIPSPQPVEASLIQVVGITRVGSYVEASSANFAYSWVRGLLPPNPGVNASGNDVLMGGVILEKIMGPISAGQLELQSANPEDPPSVTFNYFKEAEDIKRCVDGMKTIVGVINSKAFARFRSEMTTAQTLIDIMLSVPVNKRPQHLKASFSLEQFCIDSVMTIWHYHGGCQVGRVVDNDYKVFGVDSLRVVDGSTFLNSPGTNPQATVMMLGRYMGLRILRERFHKK